MLDRISGKVAAERLKELIKLEERRKELIKQAEQGDLEAYNAANLLAIRIKSIEDRIRGKANKVLDQYGIV